MILIQCKRIGIPKKFNKTIRDQLEKVISKKRKANWSDDFNKIPKTYNNTLLNSTKNNYFLPQEERIYNEGNLRDQWIRRIAIFGIRYLVLTSTLSSKLSKSHTKI